MSTREVGKSSRVLTTFTTAHLCYDADNPYVMIHVSTNKVINMPLLMNLHFTKWHHHLLITPVQPSIYYIVERSIHSPIPC